MASALNGLSDGAAVIMRLIALVDFLSLRAYYFVGFWFQCFPLLCVSRPLTFISYNNNNNKMCFRLNFNQENKRLTISSPWQGSLHSLSLRALDSGDSTTWPVPRKMVLPSRSALEWNYAQDIMCLIDEERDVLSRAGQFSQMEHL